MMIVYAYSLAAAADVHVTALRRYLKRAGFRERILPDYCLRSCIRWQGRRVDLYAGRAAASRLELNADLLLYYRTWTRPSISLFPSHTLSLFLSLSPSPSLFSIFLTLYYREKKTALASVFVTRAPI